jgi:thioredoxin reductase
MPKSTKNATISKLELAGVFMAIGSKPNSSQWRGLLPLGKDDYIVTNELMEVKIPMIFTTGDGATMAVSAERFLSLWPST